MLFLGEKSTIKIGAFLFVCQSLINVEIKKDSLENVYMCIFSQKKNIFKQKISESGENLQFLR